MLNLGIFASANYSQGANWSATLTAGVDSYSDGYSTTQYYGFSVNDIFAPDIGSLSDNTIDNLGGVECIGLYWQTSGISGSDAVILKVDGTVTNSGFTTLTVNGVDFARTSVSSFISSTVSTWRWDTADGANPFGTLIAPNNFTVSMS